MPKFLYGFTRCLALDHSENSEQNLLRTFPLYSSRGLILCVSLVFLYWRD